MHSHIYACLNHIVFEHKQHRVHVQSAEHTLTDTREEATTTYCAASRLSWKTVGAEIFYIAKKKKDWREDSCIESTASGCWMLYNAVSAIIHLSTVSLAKRQGQCWVLAPLSAWTGRYHIRCLLPLQQLKNGDNRTQHANCFAPEDFKGKKKSGQRMSC